MIGLDFVKNIDADWKKHITNSDGSPYLDDYCPISGNKCRKEDCSFWNDIFNECGYTLGKSNSINIPSFEKRPELEEIDNFLKKCRLK